MKKLEIAFQLDCLVALRNFNRVKGNRDLQAVNRFDNDS